MKITFPKKLSSFLASLALAAAVTTVGGAANAVTFGFGGSSPDSHSKFFTSGGIGLTVTAGTFNGPNPSSINYATRRVDHRNGRLGADGFFDRGQVDGFWGNDVLVFTFDQNVRIDSISFSNVDGDDDFAFGAVAGNLFDRFVNFQDVENIVFTADFLSPASLSVGNSFGIGAIGALDNFRINALTVTAVPVPAALPLLAGGIGFLGFAGWRRKRSAAA
ncbi:MAG: VPLPA-CTERM sorting domain-containing protein [Pseudomonadota bacterium]